MATTDEFKRELIGYALGIRRQRLAVEAATRPAPRPWTDEESTVSAASVAARKAAMLARLAGRRTS